MVDFLSTILIVGELAILVFAWSSLYEAQRSRAIAKTGLYSLVRHPQYVAFVLIVFGYLITWPTLPTLIIFPSLVSMYVRLRGMKRRKR